MADVLHRTTKKLIRSRNTPDYPSETWIHNPDLSGVSGVPAKYWKITGDVVSEMSQAEKDTFPTDYIYPISDFPGSDVNITKLETAITSSISVPLSKTPINDENKVTITFSTALTVGDLTILDGDMAGPAGGLIAVHNLPNKQSTKSSWTTSAILTLPDTLVGPYWIDWFSEISVTGSKFAYTRIRNITDDTTLIGPTTYSKTIRSKNVGEDWRPFTGFVPFTLDSGIKQIALEHKTSSNKVTLKIRNVYMRYRRNSLI